MKTTPARFPLPSLPKASIIVGILSLAGYIWAPRPVLADAFPPITFTSLNQPVTASYDAGTYTNWNITNSTNTVITDLSFVFSSPVLLTPANGDPQQPIIKLDLTNLSLSPNSQTNILSILYYPYINPDFLPILKSAMPGNTVGTARSPVPGPLPIIGVGIAFDYSRKIRKRIITTRNRTEPINT
jgi:hypothetical protein